MIDKALETTGTGIKPSTSQVNAGGLENVIKTLDTLPNAAARKDGFERRLLVGAIIYLK